MPDPVYQTVGQAAQTAASATYDNGPSTLEHEHMSDLESNSRVDGFSDADDDEHSNAMAASPRGQQRRQPELRTPAPVVAAGGSRTASDDDELTPLQVLLTAFRSNSPQRSPTARQAAAAGTNSNGNDEKGGFVYQPSFPSDHFHGYTPDPASTNRFPRQTTRPSTDRRDDGHSDDDDDDDDADNEQDSGSRAAAMRTAASVPLLESTSSAAITVTRSSSPTMTPRTVQAQTDADAAASDAVGYHQPNARLSSSSAASGSRGLSTSPSWRPLPDTSLAGVGMGLRRLDVTPTRMGTRDGVFNNMSAKPDASLKDHSAAPPTYDEALNQGAQPRMPLLDAAPGGFAEPRYDVYGNLMATTPGGSASGAPMMNPDLLQLYEATTIVTDLNGQPTVLYDGMPVGWVGTFFLNYVMSASFDIFGYLITSLAATSQAAKQGARAGMGITLMRYGMVIGKPQSFDDWDNVPGNVPPPAGAPTPAPGDDGTATGNSGDADETTISAETRVTSIILYVVGLMILIHAHIEYWARARRVERAVMMVSSETTRDSATATTTTTAATAATGATTGTAPTTLATSTVYHVV